MINERLKYLRKQKGINQQEIADYLDISRAAYARYETGVNSPPAEKISKLAEYFEVSADFILGRTNDPTPVRNVFDDLDGDELDAQLKELLNDPGMRVAFEDYSSWSPAEKKELIDFIMFKRSQREKSKE